MSNQRDKQITRTSIIGILTNVLLAAFKATIGLLAHSVSIVMDAVNNLSDALSSVITIVGVKLAGKAPNKQHPYGYGRIEYFSGILIAVIILVAGVMALTESIQKIIHPEQTNYTWITLLIISVAIVTKLVLGRYVKKQGEKYKSDALIASGSDATFDAIVSASTLAGACITLLWGWNLDGYIGVLISCFIIKAGAELFAGPVNQVLGTRAASETTKGIKATIREQAGVIGAYDLVLHNYGPDKAIGSVHIEIDDTMSARDLHLLTQHIQQEVMKRFHVFLTVGIYAVDNQNDHIGQIQRDIKHLVTSCKGVQQVHGVFIDHERHQISFDAVIDFKVPDFEQLRTQITQTVQNSYPDYRITVNFDIDYSD